MACPQPKSKTEPPASQVSSPSPFEGLAGNQTTPGRAGTGPCSTLEMSAKASPGSALSNEPGIGQIEGGPFSAKCTFSQKFYPPKQPKVVPHRKSGPLSRFPGRFPAFSPPRNVPRHVEFSRNMRSQFSSLRKRDFWGIFCGFSSPERLHRC